MVGIRTLNKMLHYESTKCFSGLEIIHNQITHFVFKQFILNKVIRILIARSEGPCLSGNYFNLQLSRMPNRKYE